MARCSALDTLLTSLLWTLSLRTAEGMRPGDEADNKIILDTVDERLLDQDIPNTTFTLEVAPTEYVGLQVNDSFCGPIVGLVDPQGYAARYNITPGTYIWYIDIRPVFDLRKENVKAMWARARKRAEDAAEPQPYRGRYRVTFDTGKCGFQYDSEAVVYMLLVAPAMLGLLQLFVAPLVLFVLVSVLAAHLFIKNSAAIQEEEEQSSWQPLRIMRLAVPIDHPAIYCTLVLGAVGYEVVLVEQLWEMWFFPTVLLELLLATAKRLVMASVAVVFATRPVNGWPLGEATALQAAAMWRLQRWVLVTCLLCLPFCFQWAWHEGILIQDIMRKYHDNEVVHSWQIGDVLEHGAYFLVFCGIFRFSADDVLFPTLTAKARIQRLRVSIFGEWRGHLDQVHAEIVALTTKTLPGLRASTERCVAMVLLQLLWMTCQLFRWCSYYTNSEFFISFGGKMRYTALLIPSFVALVAAISVSDECLRLVEDLNQLRTVCSVEDHEQLLMIEKLVRQSNRDQGIGSVTYGVVVTSRFLAPLILQASVLIGVAVAISEKISDSYAEVDNSLYRTTQSVRAVLH